MESEDGETAFEDSPKRERGERTKVGGAGNIRITKDVQVDANGMKATDYLKPEQIGEVGEGQKSTVELVREDREERGAENPKPPPKGAVVSNLGQPFAMFKHPSEFTEEEDVVIMNGLLAHLPLYLIAAKVRCSRGILSNHIKTSKLLQTVWTDREESLLDHVEFQAKRLVDQGNPAMIMYWLDHKGKSRGWGDQSMQDVGEDESRIVIGEIPMDEVDAAEREIASKERALGVTVDADGNAVVGTVGKDGCVVDAKAAIAATVPDPMSYAMEQDRLQKEQDARDLEQYGRTADGRTSADEDVDPETDASESYFAPWEDGGGDGDTPFGF